MTEWNGSTTFSILTLSMMTLSKMTFSKTVNCDAKHNYTYHDGTQSKMFLCWKFWVSLIDPLCWVSLCVIRLNVIARRNSFIVLTSMLTLKHHNLGCFTLYCNCKFHAWRKILFNNAMKENEILLRPKGWVQKIFWTWWPNFIKNFNITWHKFCSFWMDNNEWFEA